MNDQLSTAADNGLHHRRLFLKSGLAFSVATLLPQSVEAQDTIIDRPDWMTVPGGDFSNYGRPSPHEDDAIRWTMANPGSPGSGVSWTPLHKLEGIITPNGLHFERHHNGVPQIDPDKHQLMIHGLVRKPLLFEVKDLLRYPMQSRLCFIECGGNSNAAWRSKPIQTLAGYFHGMVSCSEWTGIPLRVLLEEVGLKSSARWAIAEGGDASAMNVSIPVEKLLDDCFLGLYQNGERVRPENGYPMRLIVPGWEGVLNVKWLRRLNFVEQPTMSRNETAKYTELLPSGKARQFSFIMEAKSIITHPSPGYRMAGPGLYQVSGLAWSGRGKIAKVEVSANGGKTWVEAELQQPVLSKCFTRFRIPWDWQGNAAVLSSRATDETGYVQPTRKHLVSQRGQHGYFHYNAIVNWAVAANGIINHAYL